MHYLPYLGTYWGHFATAAPVGPIYRTIFFRLGRTVNLVSSSMLLLSSPLLLSVVAKVPYLSSLLFCHTEMTAHDLHRIIHILSMPPTAAVLGAIDEGPVKKSVS